MGQQRWLAGCRAHPSVSVGSTSEIPGGVGCLRPVGGGSRGRSKPSNRRFTERKGWLVWAELKRKQRTRAMESGCKKLNLQMHFTIGVSFPDQVFKAHMGSVLKFQKSVASPPNAPPWTISVSLNVFCSATQTRRRTPDGTQTCPTRYPTRQRTSALLCSWLALACARSVDRELPSLMPLAPLCNRYLAVRSIRPATSDG